MGKLQSAKLHELASHYMKGGACAPGRIHGVLGRPLYVERADGPYLFDVDGNRYLDFNLSAGAAFFGYNHPRHREAIERSLELGFFMNYDSEYHYQLAELICESVPSAESVRLSNTGTEATLGAIRLARGATGRDKILHFEGHFHGMHESAFFNHGRLGKVSGHGFVETLPDSAGFPRVLSDQVITVEHNNLEAFDEALEQHRGELAAVIMEPVSYNCGCMPSHQHFLEHIRKACTEQGIVLIFDEVLSGFRMGLGGAQEHYGVTPDLTTLAKALGGGFPVAALVGRKDVMDFLTPGGSVVMSGTYTGALMPVIGAIESLKMMREVGFYDRLNHVAEGLYGGLNALFKEFEIPGHVRGIGARFAIFFGVENEDDDFDFRKLTGAFDPTLFRAFVEESLKRGLHFHYGGWSSGGVALPTHSGISSVHSEEQIAESLEAFREVFGVLAERRVRA